MQYYRPSLYFSNKQQWICYVYRSATCTFSKSSGAVRYIPKNRKQSSPQKQGSSCLSHSIDDKGTSELAHKLEEHTGIPSLVECGPLSTRHKAGAHTTSGSCLYEENDMYTASIDKYRETGVQVSSNNVPAYPSHRCDPAALLNSSDHLNKDKDRNELISKEKGTVQPAYVRLQNAANSEAKTTRQLSSSSAHVKKPALPTNVIQTGKRGADHKYFVPSETDLFPVKAGRKAFLHVAEESPHLTFQSQHLKKKEADSPARKLPPWQDAESFLLKVQRAKRRSLEPSGMQHTAAEEAGNVDVNTDNADSNLSDDDGFMLLEQETFEHSNNVHGAFTCLESQSVAEHEHAKNQAVRYLSMRPYTAAQLREKLIGRNIEPGLADYAVATVQRCGLQSDLAYAETISFARFNYRGWGPQRIKLGLKQRGIKDEIIKAAIDKVFCEEEGSMEQDGTEERSNATSMSKAAMDHLLVQATKQWNRGKTATIDTKTRRLVCWLQYRGFNYGVVKYVLNHLRNKVATEDEY